MVTGNLEAIHRRRLYQDVLDRMTELVHSGEICVGDSFPSERELAQRYQVSIAVIREAFRVLEHAGLVDGKQGSRRYLVSSALSFGPQLVGLEKTIQHDLLQARRVLEVPIVRLAAKRRNEADVRRLCALRDKPIIFEGHEEMRAGDMEFHLVLATMSRNVVLRSLQEHLNKLRAARQSVQISVETRLKMRRAHLPLIDALIAGDPEAAAEALSTHFDYHAEVLESAREFALDREQQSQHGTGG